MNNPVGPVGTISTSISYVSSSAEDCWLSSSWESNLGLSLPSDDEVMLDAFFEPPHRLLLVFFGVRDICGQAPRERVLVVLLQQA